MNQDLQLIKEIHSIAKQEAIQLIGKKLGKYYYWILLTASIFVISSIFLITNSIFLSTLLLLLLVSFLCIIILYRHIKFIEKSSKTVIKRLKIPGINAWYDNQKIAHCNNCDATLSIKRDENIRSATYYQFCQSCNAIQHSYTDEGYLISAKDIHKKAMDYFDSSNKAALN